MFHLGQKWSSTNRFIGLALVILALLFGTAHTQAQPPVPTSRPILFVHGWCGSAYDWEPLLASLNKNLPNTMFPNKSFYVIEYNIVQNSYAYYQVSDQKGVPLVTGPIQLFDLFGLGAITSSDARFFAIQFYDPLSNGTDPDNVTRISVLNKAYEI